MNQYIESFKATLRDSDQRKGLFNDLKNLAVNIIRFAIIIGVCYVILSPIIGIIVNSISSDRDAYNPMVYILQHNPTL